MNRNKPLRTGVVRLLSAPLAVSAVQSPLVAHNVLAVAAMASEPGPA